MGDMGDFWNDVKEAGRRNREQIEGSRMDSTKKSLEGRGFNVLPGPDHASYEVWAYGKKFNFWPYSGWFAGPTQGRGFKNLLKAIEKVKPSEVKDVSSL